MCLKAIIPFNIPVKEIYINYLLKNITMWLLELKDTTVFYQKRTLTNYSKVDIFYI